MYGTYCRLNVHVSALDITVVRAARSKLKRHVQLDPKKRESRKQFYRMMLDYHHDEQQTVRDFRL